MDPGRRLQVEVFAVANLELTADSQHLCLPDDRLLCELAVLLAADLPMERLRAISRGLVRNHARRIDGRIEASSTIPLLMSRLAGGCCFDDAWHTIEAKVLSVKQEEACRLATAQRSQLQLVAVEGARSRSPPHRLQRLLRRNPVPDAAAHQVASAAAVPDGPELPEPRAPPAPRLQQQQLVQLAVAAEQQNVVAQLETAQKRIEDLLAKVKSYHNKATYWKAKATGLEQQLVDLKQTGGSAHVKLEISHEKNRWLDSTSRFAVCVRRNMSACSTTSFGAIVLSDLSKATVARAETSGAEAMQGYYFGWHAEQEQALHRTLRSKGHGHYELKLLPLRDIPDEDEEEQPDAPAEPAPAPAPFVPPTACLRGFQLAFHVFAGDATNSRVYKGSKVHSMCLTSAYLRNPELVEDQRDLRGVIYKESCLADIQIVEDGTGPGTHGMLLKHFASCGCKTWLREVASRTEGKYVVDMFCYTSDRGSEQAKVRRLIGSQVLVASQDPTCLFADWDCSMHATQLIVKSGLAILDAGLRKCGKTFTYFSSIAKYVNVWRENYKNFWKLWVRADLASAMANRSLPARCIAGRWGSIYASESRLAAGEHVLQRITDDALSKRIADAEEADREQQDTDDLRVELQAEYRRRQGTWSRDAAQLSKDVVFWAMTTIAKVSHEATEFLMQTANQFSLHRNKEKAVEKIAKEGGLIFRLATGFADDVAKRFSDMLSIEKDWSGILQDGDVAHADALNQTIVLLNLHHAAGFERRIHMHCRKFLPQHLCNLCSFLGLGKPVPQAIRIPDSHS